MAISATFTTSTDEDWLRAQLSAGVTYKILLDTDLPLSLLSFNAFSAEDGTGPGVGSAGLTNNGRGESSTDNPDGSKQLVFTPSNDSLYYLQAMQFGSETVPVSYTVTIEEISDDYADNSSTTGQIGVGGQVQGTIEARDDADWFKTALLAGVTYEFVVTSSDETAPTLDAYSVEDMGNFIGSSGRFEAGTFNIGESQQSMVFTPQVDSTYYVNVDSEYDGEGPYTLTLNAISDDYADNTATTGFITQGGILNGTISVEDDADLIKMNLNPGMTYQILVNAAGTTPLAPQLFSYEDGTGLKSLGENFRFDIGTGSFDDPVSAITFSTLDGGTYYLRVENPSYLPGNFSPVNYSVSLATVVDDYADTIQTTGSVAMGGETTGNIETVNDNDWFKAQLQGGVTYVARVSPEESTGLSLEQILAEQQAILDQISAGGLSQSEVDALFSELDDLNDLLLNPDFSSSTPFSVRAASDDDLNALFDIEGRSEFVSTGPFSESYSQLVFTPRQDSTYFFDVFHDFGRTGAYTLELDALVDDFADNLSTTGTVAVGGQSNGHIDIYGDTDWFKAELQAGVSYIVRVETAGSANQFSFPLQLSVVSNEDSDGLIALSGPVQEGAMLRSEFGYYSNDNQSHVVFTPLQGGTYFIQVDGLVSDPVAYTVSIETIPDDYPDNTSTTATPGDSTPADPVPPDDVVFVEKIALLYEAALDREPDNPGLNYFVGNTREGQTLQEIANSFYLAEEFRNQFTSFDDDAYINQLYLNVLERPADQPGFDYWGEQLDNGLTHADILVSFAESAENYSNAAPWLNGLNYDSSSDMWLL